MFVNLVGGKTQISCLSETWIPRYPSTIWPHFSFLPGLWCNRSPKGCPRLPNFQRLEGYLQSGAGPRKANSCGSRASGMPILSYLLGRRPPQLRPGWLPFLVFHWGARILGLCTHGMPGGIPSRTTQVVALPREVTLTQLWFPSTFHCPCFSP